MSFLLCAKASDAPNLLADSRDMTADEAGRSCKDVVVFMRAGDGSWSGLSNSKEGKHSLTVIN